MGEVQKRLVRQQLWYHLGFWLRLLGWLRSFTAITVNFFSLPLRLIPDLLLQSYRSRGNRNLLRLAIRRPPEHHNELCAQRVAPMLRPP
eukprot:5711050-Amphidinium_carterae.1